MSTLNQKSFSGGEITPSLYARVDTSKYQTGARTIRNNIVMRHGGTQNRAGTEFVCEIRDSYQAQSDLDNGTIASKVRLISYIASSDVKYILLFGSSTIRVIKDGVIQTLTPKNIVSITQANPCVVEVTGHLYSISSEIIINDVAGMTELNGRTFKPGNVTANTFELIGTDFQNIDSTGYGAYISGGTTSEIYTNFFGINTSHLDSMTFTQSNAVLIATHNERQAFEIVRISDTSWNVTVLTPTVDQANPTGVVAVGTAGPTIYKYHVTAVNIETGEESLASIGTSTAINDPTTNSHTITWVSASGADEYNIYLEDGLSGVPGFIGTSITNTFVYDGVPEINTIDTPPTARDPITGTDDEPSCSIHYQQRRIYAGSINNPETVYCSKIGNYNNFTNSKPIADDSPVTFTMNGKLVNKIRHMIDVGKLIIFTESGEWVIQGGDAGVITPTQINAKQYSYNGSGDLAPIVIDNNAIYIQARGSIIRDLSFDFQSDGYKGNDLTIFSAHLFDGFTIVDWAYQQTPQSILWAVRSDGVLLGLTYVKEQEMLAWHRHDFDGGLVKNIQVVPEGNEDVVYVTVEREIPSRLTANRRAVYVEKFSSRLIDENSVRDSKFMDSHLTYDGRNTGTTTMTLSGGTTWASDEDLTLTRSVSDFTASDVGNAIHFPIINSKGVTTDKLRCTITAYTSGTVVTVRSHKIVQTALRSTATTTWEKAVDLISGLWHLEGLSLSIFADAFVVASPLNESYNIHTVVNGSITLDKPYAVIHAGLPYISDLETLNVNSADGETLDDKKKIVGKVDLFVENTRGMWAGGKAPSDDEDDALEDLQEFKLRNAESMEDPIGLKTEVVSVNIKPEWNSNGRVFVRQIDPLPMSILSVSGSGKFPFKG